MKIGEVYKPLHNILNTSSVQITKVNEVYSEVTYMYLEPFDGKIVTSFESFDEHFELDNDYEDR